MSYLVALHYSILYIVHADVCHMLLFLLTCGAPLAHMYRRLLDKFYSYVRFHLFCTRVYFLR